MHVITCHDMLCHASNELVFLDMTTMTTTITTAITTTKTKAKQRLFQMQATLGNKTLEGRNVFFFVFTLSVTFSLSLSLSLLVLL